MICEVDERYRSACEGLPLYAEHEGKPYCVLHFPGEEKKDDFKKVLDSKLAKRNYDFGGTVFPPGASEFEGRELGAGARFSGATFCASANFARTTFKETVSFRKATFMEKADFSDAIFQGTARFRKATFENEADFSGTIFQREASFRRATFKGFVEFKASSKEIPCKAHTFNGRANFSAAKFEERATFVGRCTFDTEHGETTFRNALINKPENFSLDRVQLRPSWFIDTNVQRFRFTNVRWHGLSSRSSEAIDAEIEAIRERRRVNREVEELGYPRDVLARTCRELSANAEENRDYPTANEFHYWSMEAVREEGLSRSSPIVTLYWALSGYGVRAARAFWALVVIWATFAILYALVDPSEFKDFGQGIGYIWQAAVYSLLALARLNPEPKPEEPGMFQFLVGLEGILGPLQIALLALAVRRKVMR